MSWELVRAWREKLRAADPSFQPTGLSKEGAKEALDAALEALDDESLDRVAALGGRAFPTVAVVTARTVTTAPIEWCAVCLGRGSTVLLKHSVRDPGLSSLLITTAREVGLPLVGVTERAAIRAADLVVAMGTDETIEDIRRTLPARTRMVPHGHRFSVAWLVDDPMPVDPRVPEGFDSPFAGVAADAAMHDGRGCYSPVAVFTSLPLDEAVERMAKNLERANRRWPVGTISPAEHAALRARRALAKVVGAVREGPGWSVHGLPVGHLEPVALPRSVAVFHVEGPEEAARALTPFGRWLSTVGTDDPESTDTWLKLGATRICRPGRMQRPPLVRHHDGEDWLRATAIWVSDES